jgi:hypothetical protein
MLPLKGAGIPEPNYHWGFIRKMMLDSFIDKFQNFVVHNVHAVHV